jgi:DsbE subfamily thiol:disulfide oxidoreductase
MKIYLRGGVVVVLILLALGALYSHYASKLPANRNPEQFSKLDQMEKEGVPAFELPRLEGNALYRSSEFKGKVVVLNFWASWCNPCVEEFPSLLQLARKFPKDIQLVAISVDENRDDAIQFLKSLGGVPATVVVLWDPQRLAANRYGVEKIPESFLIHRDGKLIRKVMGVDNWVTANAISYFEELVAH